MPALSTRLRTRLRHWVAAWREGRARRQLRHVDADLLERSVRETGMSSVDLRLARLGARAEFEQMAQHFGVDPERVAPHLLAPLRDAERVCAFCQDVRRCRRWLAREAGTDAPRLFCPNAQLFDEVAASDPGRRPGGGSG
jgi:hypothetical protein